MAEKKRDRPRVKSQFNKETELKLTDLIPLEELQKIQNSWSNLTEIAILIERRDGTGITKQSRPSNLCWKYVRKTKKGCERCVKNDRELMQLTRGATKPLVRHCKSYGNFLESAWPIIVEGKHIASVVCGEWLEEPPDIEKYKKIARELGVDEEGFIEALKQIPIIPKEKYMNAIELLHQLALTLSDLGYQRLKEQRMRGEIQNKIEEIRERETEIKEARAYAEAIIANIADPLWVTDKNDNWVLINQAMENVIGYTEQELVGKKMSEQPMFEFFLSMPDSKEKLEATVEKIKVGEHVPGVMIPWLTKDKGILMMSCSGEPLRNAKGDVVGGVFIGKDMSTLRRAGIAATKILNRNVEAKVGRDYNLITQMFMSNAILLVGDSSLEILRGAVDGYNKRFKEKIRIEDGISLNNVPQKDWPSFTGFLLNIFYECIGPATFECCEGIKCIENIVEKVKVKYGDTGEGL